MCRRHRPTWVPQTAWVLVCWHLKLVQHRSQARAVRPTNQLSTTTHHRRGATQLKIGRTANQGCSQAARLSRIYSALSRRFIANSLSWWSPMICSSSLSRPWRMTLTLHSHFWKKWKIWLNTATIQVSLLEMTRFKDFWTYFGTEIVEIPETKDTVSPSIPFKHIVIQCMPVHWSAIRYAQCLENNHGTGGQDRLLYSKHQRRSIATATVDSPQLFESHFGFYCEHPPSRIVSFLCHTIQLTFIHLRI